MRRIKFVRQVKLFFDLKDRKDDFKVFEPLIEKLPARNLDEGVLKKEFNKFELLLEKSFDYDFESIDVLNYKIDPRNVKRVNKPIHLKFFHKHEQQREISNALYLYKDHTDGLHRLLYETRLQKFYRNFQQSNIPIEFNGKNKVLPDTTMKIEEQKSVRRFWEDF